MTKLGKEYWMKKTNKKIRHQKKIAHKWNLENNTRIGWRKQIKTILLEFCIKCVWHYRFMLNWILQSWMWNIKHIKLNVLSHNRRYNCTKTEHQLIVINFLKSLLLHYFSRVRILDFVRISFIIFFFVFWIYFFFLTLF